MTCPTPVRGLRVREKLLMQGPQSLSDMELLAAFISSGTAKRSCFQLAQDLLGHLGDLRAVLNADLKAFQSIPGLGMVRFVQLQALKEICRRSDFTSLQQRMQLHNSHHTHRFLKRQLRDKKNETFAALFLDTQHRVIAYEELFTGTINSAAVHSRPLIERVLKFNAAAVILAHNHPSGYSKASPEDITVTKRLKKALELVDVRLLDHLVIGDNEVYSILHDVVIHPEASL